MRPVMLLCCLGLVGCGADSPLPMAPTAPTIVEPVILTTVRPGIVRVYLERCGVTGQCQGTVTEGR